MAKKLKTTPRSRVRSALRQVWLRSRERAEAIRRADATCACCGKKRSVAKGREVKLEVHHEDGIDWDALIDVVYERLLCSPDRLVVMCAECHHVLTDVEEGGKTK